MADIFDAASDLEELHRAKAIEYRKPILSPIGKCHNCLEPLEDNRLFCDVYCASDFEERDRINKLIKKI